MSRPSNPNGVRRAHTRNGKPVRAGSIKRRQAPKRRLNASARRRVQRKPMLYAAGTLAGLGALDAILTGRWGGAIVLGSLAGGFLLGHLVWSHHQNRQARKPAAPRPKPAKTAPQQRREALEKARAAHQAATAPLAERPVWRGSPRLRYDAMVATMASQRRKGLPERVSPSDYEEFFDGPGKLKQRPGPASISSSTPKAASTEPASHEEWQTLNGKQCDCTKCRAKRKTEKAEVLR